MAVDARLLKQINHNDPKERRKAIIALADCRDMTGVPPLEKAAKSDDDPKLRELAGKALNHLKEQIEKAAERAANPDTPLYVPEKQIERSKAYMTEAMSMVVAKDNAKAAKALAKALEANPNLRQDSYFMSMVSSLFNVNGEQAIRLLTSGEAREDFVKKQEKNKVQKRKDEHTSKAREIGWYSVGFDLTIYAVVAAIITFFAPLVYSQLITRAAEYQAALTPDKYAEETVKIPELAERSDDDFPGWRSGATDYPGSGGWAGQRGLYAGAGLPDSPIGRARVQGAWDDALHDEPACAILFTDDAGILYLVMYRHGHDLRRCGTDRAVVCTVDGAGEYRGILQICRTHRCGL